MKQCQIDFNRKICKALGIEFEAIKEIDIHIDALGPPLITVTRILQNEDLSDFADVISNYEVVVNDPTDLS